MKKIPITLEQYECMGCKHKWYINTQDKIDNKMDCPYGCGAKGDITRKFEMMIHNYEEYVQEGDDYMIPTLSEDSVDKYEGGKE